MIEWRIHLTRLAFSTRVPTTHELAALLGVLLHREPILVTGFEHVPDVWTQHWGARIPVPPHADFYVEIRERKGCLVMQQDVPREFSKLDIPHSTGNGKKQREIQSKMRIVEASS